MRSNCVMFLGVTVALARGPAAAAQTDAEFHYRSDDREFGISLGLDQDRYYETHGPPYVETDYVQTHGVTEIDYVDVDEFGDIQIDAFFDALASYGEWRYRRPYGWVWTPHSVHQEWRPYTRGHWTYTDHGWTWVSREPWGWAAEHYGRWYFEPGLGWTWVPGTRWGPAWVAWRQGPNYIGWAPLPPQVRWRPGYGLDTRIDLEVALGPSAWSFVEDRYFVSPQVYSYIASPSYNVTYLRRAPLSLEYAYVGDRIVNRGIPITRVEQVVGRRIYPTPIRVHHARPSGRYTYYDGGTLNIYRPRFSLSRTRDYDRWDRGRRSDWDDRRGRRVDDRWDDRDRRDRDDWDRDGRDRDRRGFDRDGRDGNRDFDRRRTIQSDPRRTSGRDATRTSDPRVRREIDRGDDERTRVQRQERTIDSPPSDAVRQPQTSTPPRAVPMPAERQQQVRRQASTPAQAERPPVAERQQTTAQRQRTAELQAERQRQAQLRRTAPTQAQRETTPERQRSAQAQRKQRAQTVRQSTEARRDAARERAEQARERQVQRTAQRRSEAAQRQDRREADRRERERAERIRRGEQPDDDPDRDNE